MKILKLLLVALIIVGGIVGLLFLNSGSEELKEPTFTSLQANEWKEKINQLCSDDNWTPGKYDEIESGIHTDRVTSKGDLINGEEEQTLNRYLFSLSCEFLWKSADKHFKQQSYSEKKIEGLGAGCDFLTEQVERFGKNSNLTALSSILSSYQVLKRSLNFSSHARYSRPLKAFPGGSAVALQQRIREMKEYQSHFCHNLSIQSKVEHLISDRQRAEREYYENLELLIERNYTTDNDLETLLEDQIRFNEISTNEEAVERLTNFVNNPNI